MTKSRWLLRRSVSDAVSAELDFHVAMLAQELIARGTPPDDARRMARDAFIDRQRVAAECVSIAEATDRRTVRREYVSELRDDLRYTARQLLRAPAFTLGVVATLALGAALFVQSLHNVESLNPGYDVDRLIYAGVRFNGPSDEHVVAQRVDQVVAAIAVSSGIERASRTSAVPLQRGGFGIPWYTATDSMGQRPFFRPTGSRVTPGYFATVGLHFAAGGDFTPGARNVIVNQTMADAIWPGRSAIGECIHLGQRDAPCHRVSAIVRDAKRSTVIERALPQYFVASDDTDAGGLPEADFVVVRVPPARSAAAQRALGQRLSAAFPDGRVRIIPLLASVDEQYRPWRLGALLFSVFGVLALVVASIGIYSTVSYEVAQRTREFGIRAALGASLGQIVQAVLRAGLTPVIAGVWAGLGVALAAGRVVSALLYEIAPGNLGALLLAGGLLMAAGLLAALVPAARGAGRSAGGVA